jgi:glycosyltransferase involved in cell wall biosynthesis
MSTVHQIGPPARARRVVINGRFLAQQNTGVQRYARETLLALDALLPDLQPPIDFVLCVPRGASELPLRHIRLKRLPWLSGHAWEQVTLALFARRDLLLNLSYSGPVLKKNQVITVHDATVHAMPGCFSTPYRLVHRALLPLLRNRVACVMTVSEFSALEIRHRYCIDNRIVVGREGWSHSLSRGNESAVLEKYGLASGRYLLLVGSVKPNKNLDVVARALATMPQLPWTVVVAGSANARLFRDVPLRGDRMKFLGFVADEDLGTLYKHAAWFLFPSLYEGFGLPALEAMANGCPVIAADAGSLPEVCGDAALYFEATDARALAALLQSLVGREDIRDRVRSNARPRLERYTWTANARILLDEVAGLR